LEAIAQERQQSSGGRLDILLKNPEDDSMYEVEVMLGETDETHIIRTIHELKWAERFVSIGTMRSASGHNDSTSRFW
jgi:hypothetical protein